MNVNPLIRELKKLDLEGELLFFDEYQFYRIVENPSEQGTTILINEIRNTYNIKIKKS